jgi:hypothetical protein
MMGRAAKVFLLGCGGAALLWAAWSSYSFTKQVDAWIVLDFYSRQLQKMHSEGGRYPATFDVRDRRGEPIAYFHNDAHFVLVSFGSDGTSDGPDYGELLSSTGPIKGRRNCLRPALDTVIVDGAMWQGCSN